jgi:uncharacterized protein DUF3710
VSLFRRRRDRQEPEDAEVRDAELEAELEDDADEAEDDGEDGDDAGEVVVEVGPYDVDDAPDDDLERLDLGSMRIPAVAGVEVRMQASEQGQVGNVVLVTGGNALQLGVFAAPRSEGIWDEVRAELRDGIRKEGGTVTEQDGEYGPELRARVKTPEGPADVRFVGVDGPRWFVRAAFQGKVATDPSAAPELLECLHNLVVDRGKDAMPVMDPLPLHLPEEAVKQQEAEAEADGANGSDGADGADGKKPPSRRR